MRVRGRDRLDTAHKHTRRQSTALHRWSESFGPARLIRRCTVARERARDGTVLFGGSDSAQSLVCAVGRSVQTVGAVRGRVCSLFGP